MVGVARAERGRSAAPCLERYTGGARNATSARRRDSAIDTCKAYLATVDRIYEESDHLAYALQRLVEPDEAKGNRDAVRSYRGQLTELPGARR